MFANIAKCYPVFPSTAQSCIILSNLCKSCQSFRSLFESSRILTTLAESWHISPRLAMFADPSGTSRISEFPNCRASEFRGGKLLYGWANIAISYPHLPNLARSCIVVPNLVGSCHILHIYPRPVGSLRILSYLSKSFQILHSLSRCFSVAPALHGIPKSRDLGISEFAERKLPYPRLVESCQILSRLPESFHVLPDVDRPCRIPRGFRIFRISEFRNSPSESCRILPNLAKSGHVLSKLFKSCRIFPNHAISRQVFPTLGEREFRILLNIAVSHHVFSNLATSFPRLSDVSRPI